MESNNILYHFEKKCVLHPGLRWADWQCLNDHPSSRIANTSWQNTAFHSANFSAYQQMLQVSLDDILSAATEWLSLITQSACLLPQESLAMPCTAAAAAVCRVKRHCCTQFCLFVLTRILRSNGDRPFIILVWIGKFF